MKDFKDKSLPIFFITSFVQAVLNKIDAYKKQTAVLSKPEDKESSSVDSSGAIAGAVVGALFTLIQPAAGALATNVGKEIGSKAAHYKYKKCHKKKAKDVLNKLEDNVAHHLFEPTEVQVFIQLVSNLIEGGIEIYRAFEYQLHQIWFAQIPPVRRNMEKVAVDAADRLIDFIHVGPFDKSVQLNCKTIVKGVLTGRSKSSFSFTLSKRFSWKSGRNIDNNGKWNTNDMFELTKVAVTGRDVEDENGVYVRKGKETDSEKYGIRLTTIVEDEEFYELLLNGVYRRHQVETADHVDGFTPLTLEELKKVAVVVQNSIEANNIPLMLHNLQSHLITHETGENIDSNSSKIVTIEIPKPDDYCVKRNGLVTEALAILRSEEEPNPILVLCGFGGFGKTQVAKMVVAELDKDYDVCVWIDCETAVADVKDILQLNHVQFSIDSSWKVLWTLFQQLLKGTKALVVFDNVESEKRLIECLSITGSSSSICREFSVIVTSQKEMKFELLGVKNVHNIRVSYFEEEEAVTFVKDSLSTDDYNPTESDLNELIKLSGKIPLTLSTMCATIRWMNVHSVKYKIQDYLKDFRKTDIGRDVIVYGEGNGDHLELEYGRSLRTSMEVAVNQIRNYKPIGPFALEILDRIVYGPLVNGTLHSHFVFSLPHIEESAEIVLKQPRYSRLREDGVIREALTLLDEFSILRVRPNVWRAYDYSMNNILADVRRYTLHDSEEEKGILREILEYLPKVEDELLDNEGVACAVWRYAASYPDLCRSFFQKKGNLLELTRGGSSTALKKILDSLGPEEAMVQILSERLSQFWPPYSPLEWAAVTKNLPVLNIYCTIVTQAKFMCAGDLDACGVLIDSAAHALSVNEENVFSRLMQSFGRKIGDTNKLFAELRAKEEQYEDNGWITNWLAAYILFRKVDIPWSYAVAVNSSVLKSELFIKYCEKYETKIEEVARNGRGYVFVKDIVNMGGQTKVVVFVISKLGKAAMPEETIAKFLEASAIKHEYQDIINVVAEEFSKLYS